MRRASLVAVVLLLLAVPGAVAATPWSGYLIDDTGRADGGLLGARKVGDQVIYRTQADARAVPTGYRPVERRSGDRSVARAAWILSVYGAVRVADQAAAVDLATYALLSGKRIGGPRADSRLRQTGRASVIRALARSMLRESTERAGPYRVRVSARPVEVGERVRVSVRVTTARGRAVANAPLRLRVGDRVVRARTSATGRAEGTAPGRTPGWLPVRVTVRGVPEWRLHVRAPQRRAASAVAVAGRRATVEERDRVAVRARPQVRVDGAEALVGRDLAGRLTLAGVQGVPSVVARVDLHGPFPTPATGCTGEPVARRTLTVGGDGSYAVPAVRPGAAGYYVWRAVVPRSDLNTRAESCGGLVRARAVPVVSLDATETEKRGTRLAFTVGALPPSYAGSAEVRLYGPFQDKENVDCRKAKRLLSTSVPVAAPGAYAVPRVPLERAGYYVWRVRTAPTDLAVGVTAGCGTAGSRVRVR